MGEIVASITVYNSITNNLNDEKLDARAPFSLVEFLSYIGNLAKTSEELELYNTYLRSWQKTSNVKLSNINADLKSQFITFLTEVKLLYSSPEEKRYLDNINLNSDEQLSIAIPFFAKKIKDISQYFSKKRKELKRDIEFTKSKGSRFGLVESIKNELLDLYSGDDVSQDLSKPSNIGAFIDGLSIEIENKYDTFNDYYDLDPQKAPIFYNTVEGEDRFKYFTSNTNPISGTFFYDTEQAIKDIISNQQIAISEIPGLTINSDSADITNLPKTFFQDYRNTDTNNLKYLLQAELMQKFMGTDMYFLSSNSTSNILSGKMFDAEFPHRNLLNINNSSTIQVPGNDFKTEREVGLFFKPTKHGILKMDAAFEPILDTTSIDPNTVYIFPDPSKYGRIAGLGESAKQSPFIFVLKDLEFKNSSSSYGKSLVKSNSDSQNFYSYSSIEQDNQTKNNETPLPGLQVGELSGNITKEVSDIYGNTFFLITPTTNSNRNVANFTATETPLEIAETSYASLTADGRKTIDEKRRGSKKILIYNTLADTYQNIQTALSGVFSKYIYNTPLYNELNNNITDINVFKNTFFIRTLNYIVIDNIVYNDDSSFTSKIFVSRVKNFTPNIVTSLNKTRISNYSNPIRLGNDIFTIKAESEETTSPLNNRIFNFSIFKYDLNKQVEISIIDESTTNRSYFAENFNFSVGTNIVQIRDMKLSFNKKQNKFFLLTDFSDLNNVDHFHVLVFEIRGNKLTIHRNFVIGPSNDNSTINFYKTNELTGNFSTQTLSSSPTQNIKNGTFNF